MIKVKCTNYFIIKINNHIKEEFKNTEGHLASLGLLLFIGYIGFYFLNSLFFTTQDYENLYLRLIVAALAVPILFAKYLPQSIADKYLHIHWYITLLYCLPFFFGFMLLKNPNSNIWQINGLVGLTILTLFVGVISYIFLFTIGSVLAFAVFWFTSSHSELPSNIIGVFGSYIPPIIYFIIFSTKQHKIYQEKISAMKVLSGIIAHEMRTPLAGITAAAHAFKKYLPILIKGYSIAKEQSMISENIPKTNLNLLEKLPHNISQLANDANVVIDMMLMRLKQIDNINTDNICSFKECISKALTQYSFMEGERELVNFDHTQDFKFKGNELLIIHVLFNLLKNAIYYVRAVGKGDIKIWIELGDKYNKLYFKDTGAGISQKAMVNLFKPFNTDTRHGTGLGLAFCKEVMEKIKGKISCDSKAGEYTQFTLSFQKLED
ncbi:sensor histidine kinase [Rickettsiales endosymbiont of Stachyamoeba lipophora]|uniref:sensor histidine kinase n=1 Tax=Rickettsiales endosymbiont of Stachyamoeba lipophora TaxID=2486578 RepID=UPI000F648D32|nr:HAMP domain-containing sensor histidine kinase [Rickettsiales endosymbiont of Stachyamoeba lipophora]AZL16103.1 sensor histidine kinase [Rickettsiales endosymbiont of Stachyamoeba lipophora]